MHVCGHSAGGCTPFLLGWLLYPCLQVGKEETFMDSIKTEIAIMKKVQHPNVLRLYEVMDDPKVRRGGGGIVSEPTKGSV